tara:strand:- start:1791 stop:2459 length:669 start_codon:yes stop_codon:yes gene_type:complete
MKKILILTDSIANPRPATVSDETHLEETYPFMLRKQFKDALFYQLSFGNITTEEIVNQAIGYLSHWKPDLIIVHSGINDCRPEAFTESQKDFFLRLTGFFSRFINKHLYNPKLIKWRQLARVSKYRFKKTLKKFKLIFNQSKILWIEITSAPEYEKSRPGVLQRTIEYNQIISEIYGDDLIKINKEILDNKGFNMDNIHWNKKGHKVVEKILLKKIKDDFKY